MNIHDLWESAKTAMIGGAGFALVAGARYAVPSVSRTVRHWIKGRQQSDQLAGDLARAGVEAQTHAQDRFLDRISEQDKRIDSLRDEMDRNRVSDREECNRLREADAQHCREEIERRVDDVRRDLGQTAHRLASVLADRDEPTGVHEMEGVVARSTSATPPPPPRRRAPEET